MRKHETVLQKNNYEILRTVAQYAYEGTLEEKWDSIPYSIIPGTKATFRCCVYRERAIVFQRVRLAMGKAPNDRESDTDNKYKGQNVFVINSACEQCSINRFTVTENCQGCLTRRCMKACAFKAISIVNKKAYINQDECRECGRCKEACPYNAIADQMRPCRRSCPVDAIKIDEDRKAVIDFEKCINCGACAVECPFGAISDKHFIVPVINAIKSGKPVYAAIAPSIEAQFGDKINLGIIKNAIKKLGFTDVYEVALGADMVAAHEAEEFAKDISRKKFMTSSCCPAFVNLIKKHYPELADNVSGTVSPMVAIGRYIKNQNPNAVVVFIGPCIAKKGEAEALENSGTDYILTFEELEAMFGAKNIKIEECSAEGEEQATYYGRMFAKSGGVTFAVEKAIHEKGLFVEFKPLKCNGAEECKKALALGKAGKLQENFIEGMICCEGCIGGPAKLESPIKARRTLDKIDNECAKKRIYMNLDINKTESIDLHI